MWYGRRNVILQHHLREGSQAERSCPVKLARLASSVFGHRWSGMNGGNPQPA